MEHHGMKTMVTQKIMTLAVAAMIALVTALGIWVSPFSEKTIKLIRDAARNHEESAKSLRDQLNGKRDSDAHNILRHPIALQFAPVEVEAALAATITYEKALSHQAQTLENFAAKLRQQAARHEQP